jgi:ZIP Zinc transporter.
VVACYWLPVSFYSVSLFNQVDITVSLCLSLGGGVLLATCFIHMIPEVRHSIETHSAHSSHHFPFTELLVCIGFFIVYIVEESVRHCLQTRRGAKSGEGLYTWLGTVTQGRFFSGDISVFLC